MSRKSVLRWLMLALGGIGLPHGAMACGPYELTFYEYGSLYYRGEDGQYQGIDPDVVTEVARRSGCTFHTRLDSRKRTWVDMAEGQLDLTVSGLETPERRVYAEFIPYLNTRNYLIVHDRAAPAVKSLASFAAERELRLAVIRGFMHGTTIDAFIEKLRSEGRVDDYPDAETAMRLFARGRVDGIFAEPATWEPLLRRNQIQDKVRKLDVAPQDRAIGGLVVSRQRVRSDDAAALRRAISEMRADGTLRRIFGRYLDAETARDVARAP